MFFKVVAIVVLAAFFSVGEARVFGQCELVQYLRSRGVNEGQVPTWTCIAFHESAYDTAAYNPSSGDHGIFQISEIYWCSTGGSPGNGCNKRCDDFMNDDISDDLTCVLQIFDEFQGREGNGFLAWTTYLPYCAGDNSGFVAGC